MAAKTKSALIHWVEFTLALTEKEIKARYKYAWLGFLWIFLNPLFQMLVIGFVFQFFVPSRVDNYFSYLFAGLLPWNSFSQSILRNTSIIVNERELICKAKFPRESIVLSVVLSNLFHLVIATIVFFIWLIIFKLFFQSQNLVEIVNYSIQVIALLPPMFFFLTIFTSGLSLFLAALNVKFRDINFMVQALVPLWFYATPIVYSLSLMPESIRVLFYLNPMTFLIESFHYVLLGIPPFNPAAGFISIIFAIIFSYIGLRFFLKESNYFDDWI